MRNLILTFFLGIMLSFTASAQNKTLYDSPTISIQTEEIECGETVYANFIFNNKTSNTITLTYNLEMKFVGEFGYVTDYEHGIYTVIINPNGTVTGACGSNDYLLFLGKKDGRVFIVDCKLTNVLTN